jgi:hypothetical protein
MNINVHIERLILDGLPLTSSQGAVVQTAIEMELARLLGANPGGILPDLRDGGTMPSVRAGGLPLADKSSPAQIGHQIAGILATTLRAATPRSFSRHPSQSNNHQPPGVIL